MEEMVLREFEEWLKEEIKFNKYDAMGIAFTMAEKKLESLKVKHGTA